MENLADLDVEVLRRVLDGDCRTGSLHNLAAYTDRSKALYTFNLNGETAGLHILLTDDAIEKARTMIDSLSFLQHHTDLPVLSVIASCLTTRNPLSRAYYIVSHEEGTRLSTMYAELSQVRREMITDDLFAGMTTLLSTSMGMRAGQISKKIQVHSADTFEMKEQTGIFDEPWTSSKAFLLDHLHKAMAAASQAVSPVCCDGRRIASRTAPDEVAAEKALNYLQKLCELAEEICYDHEDNVFAIAHVDPPLSYEDVIVSERQSSGLILLGLDRLRLIPLWLACSEKLPNELWLRLLEHSDYRPICTSQRYQLMRYIYSTASNWRNATGRTTWPDSLSTDCPFPYTSTFEEPQQEDEQEYLTILRRRGRKKAIYGLRS